MSFDAPGFTSVGFEAPGFAPVANGDYLYVPNTFDAPGFNAPGFTAPGFPPIFLIGPPVVFLNELSNWLTGKLNAPVYPNQLPQRNVAYPLLSYVKIDSETTMKLGGTAGLSWVVLQFDAWGLSHYACELLQTKLFNALAGYQGPCNAAVIDSVIPGRELTDFEEGPTGDAAGIYRSMREYRIAWQQAIPLR